MKDREKYLFITFVGDKRGQVTVAVERDQLSRVAVSRDDDTAFYYKTDGNIEWGSYPAKETRLVPTEDPAIYRREVIE